MAEKKPKKRYSLYRQGVNDAIESMTDLLLNDIFSYDCSSYVNQEEIQEKVKYLRKKLKELVE